ncbi:3-mercaptopyruvate sulfurtransferase [Bartonella sp. HY406]|uniref:3-mercaptopyruvate sulfurtransferase n=1 Tax=Bartonella sp. HY406 TaxID=2979331 RepID=UPI0021C76478|nr:3-mercaptopyruvate sulfurtransferase [Bartonella sp. HY406]UXN04637.1 3-mercaptopyruvate sulfurtransferase [Bartonella sp. HY406]
MSHNNPFIVSADWLESQLGASDIHIIDASWYLPKANRNGRLEYSRSHIPEAVFFDHDLLSDPNSSLPHTLPDAEYFAKALGALGISEKNTIVVYDGDGFFSAPRAWWLLRLMGAEKVYVLDGGFKTWQQEGRPVTSNDTIITPKIFNANADLTKVVLIDEMRGIVSDGNVAIADARGKKRFSGEEKEPRAGVRSGHMPNAQNVPYSLLSDEGKFKSNEEIFGIFKSAGIDPLAPVVTTCGSGVTAAVLTLALQGLGNENVRLYDGSWSEWGSLADSSVVTDEDLEM